MTDHNDIAYMADRMSDKYLLDHHQWNIPGDLAYALPFFSSRCTTALIQAIVSYAKSS
jgi:hypothetical protein